MENIDEWYALYHMGLYETNDIKQYGPFTFENITSKYPLSDYAPSGNHLLAPVGFMGTFFGKDVCLK